MVANNSFHRRLLPIATAILAGTACMTLLHIHKAMAQNPYCPKKITKPIRRTNFSFKRANRIFNTSEFKLVYRMSRSTFKKLLFLVEPELIKHEKMARKVGRPVISPEVRLGILLRMMAGARVYECMSAFEVGRSTVYEVFKFARQSVDRALRLPGLPESVSDLRRMAVDFQTSRSPPNPLPGCVGALDGISIKIPKPANHEQPATFYCRKGYYALPVQAVADSKYRFLCFSAKCRGSTHDALAHAVSALGSYLDQGRLDSEFWIAGDEAYVCTESLICPVPASQANEYEDSFNFYHSSLRMHVEQAFGMLVAKWKILKALNFSVGVSAEVISVALKLHNFCIEHGDGLATRSTRSTKWRDLLDQSQDWYEEGKVCSMEHISNSRSAHSSRKRDSLIFIIEKSGFQRPPVRSKQIPAAFASSFPALQ